VNSSGRIHGDVDINEDAAHRDPAWRRASSISRFISGQSRTGAST
jgi:hypothetical protein